VQLQAIPGLVPERTLVKAPPYVTMGRLRISSRSLLLRYAIVATLACALTIVFTSLWQGSRYARQLALSNRFAVGGSYASVLDTRPKVPVFIIVKTVPDDRLRRQVMRETWLSIIANSREMEYRYFCEEPQPAQRDALETEARHEGDIVILDGLEQKAHRKIGPKMIRSFEWIVEHRNVQHVIVSDDDTYTNAARLLGDYKSWKPALHYLGWHIDGQPVIKVPKGTIRVGKYGEVHDFPTNKWPRYASGPFYALSTDLLEAFVNPPLPLRTMSSNDAMTGAVLMAYDVNYETREGKSCPPLGTCSCLVCFPSLITRFLLRFPWLTVVPLIDSLWSFSLYFRS
jgi:Galactosyltransferase